MKYMLLIYGSEAARAHMTPADAAAEMQEYAAFSAVAVQRGVLVGGEALHLSSTATTVRVRDGQTLKTDGPFAETHEQLGGFYILDCRDLDEAIEMAAKIPGAKDGSIEIRPIMIFDQS
jgi:hypothetical protein